MKLHNDKEKFIEAIIATSKMYGFDPALIEKDYFVTLFLKKAVERIPGLVFKGGTSLSKCYNLIDRFSEDIDLLLMRSILHKVKKENL
ncbi:MAG: nucleotidyl transferase AbiEii/AbiGii toxin family protein [Bacilli bacterium]